MGIKIIDRNKRAGYDFFLFDKFEAGMVLKGPEVKSIRGGKVNISDAFITIDGNGEAWAHNIYVGHYEFGNINNPPENRSRKLLLNREEIKKIFEQQRRQKYSIVPTIIYFKNSTIKLEIALAKGKKLHDKRASESKRDVERHLKQGQYD